MVRQTRTRSPRNDSDKRNPQPEADGIPYNLRRELEEIMKNSGREIDLSLPVVELEAICNLANHPADSWRNRWS